MTGSLVQVGLGRWTPDDLKAALEALTTVKAGGVTVTGTGTYNNPFVFEFTSIADKAADGAFFQLAAETDELARSNQKLSVSTVTEGTAELREIQQVAIECRNSKVPLDLLALLPGKVIQAGVIDVASDHVKTFVKGGLSKQVDLVALDLIAQERLALDPVHAQLAHEDGLRRIAEGVIA